jgi:hypothetical protein
MMYLLVPQHVSGIIMPIIRRTAPTMTGLIKLHKENTPVRPVINWRKAPGYKLAKKMAKILTSYIPLPFAYNVKNTIQLMNELMDIPYDPNTKFASFDISNMYSNIPTDYLIVTLKKLCKVYNLDNTTTRVIIRVTQTLTEQNYFRFRDKFYVQNEGLAVGASTSSILSEVYLQYMENTTIYDFLLKHKVGYFRYVDDILLMYKEDNTNIHRMLDDLNNLAPTLKFTLEEEQDNKINFLDITITKQCDSLAFEIYRKPTATDIIIPNDPCHPREHKTAAIR